MYIVQGSEFTLQQIIHVCRQRIIACNNNNMRNPTSTLDGFYTKRLLSIACMILDQGIPGNFTRNCISRNFLDFIKIIHNLVSLSHNPPMEAEETYHSTMYQLPAPHPTKPLSFPALFLYRKICLQRHYKHSLLLTLNVTVKLVHTQQYINKYRVYFLNKVSFAVYVKTIIEKATVEILILYGLKLWITAFSH